MVIGKLLPQMLYHHLFLIFIVNSENLQIWLAYDNSTKITKRIPSDEVLYLYDPILREDDIPFDNRRSGMFLAKIPYSDNWSLVLYSGASVIPLSFQWSIVVTEGIWYDIVLYSIGFLLLAIVIIVFVIKIIKDKKRSNKDEIEELIEEQEKKKQSRNLDEIEE